MNNRSFALNLAALSLGMLMLAYASVPLYRLFCAATGFGGTTKEAAGRAPVKPIDREMTVTFNADTDPALAWEFAPGQKSVKARVGEQTLVYYTAKNLTKHAITGQAVYNVTPFKAGKYFVKVECFCFKQQTLAAGESAHMPVSFYIDPAIADDHNLDDLKTITLSYTFFEVKK